MVVKHKYTPFLKSQYTELHNKDLNLHDVEENQDLMSALLKQYVSRLNVVNRHDS